jgi:hypothetical protein
MSAIVGKKRNIQVLRGLSLNRSLLSCTSDGTKVDLWNTDDDSGRQQWDITLVDGFVDVYNIKVSGGNSSSRVFLSCTKDGAKVDLWNTDDGSGRQRWQFVPLASNIPDYFQIKVVGGVEGGRVYLSCTPDGTKVDLWSIDDGSGRQRWQHQ